MTYTDNGFACPDCAAQLTTTADLQGDHAGPCFQKGPRRCPSCRHAHKTERCIMAAGVMTWVISEDKFGFIQPGDNTNGIARVFTQDGTVLAEAAPTTPEAAVVLSSRDLRGGRRVERLLRYYVGRRGRRVVVQDRHGSRWRGRITGTRWHPKGRVWFILNCPETAAA